MCEQRQKQQYCPPPPPQEKRYPPVNTMAILSNKALGLTPSLPTFSMKGIKTSNNRHSPFS